MPLRGYLLCCLPRTGSTLLAEALAATGVAGRPLEYFNPFEQQKPWMREILGDSSMVNGLSKILIAGATANGWFGAKVHWLGFRHLGMSVRGEWNDAEREVSHELLRSQLPNLVSPAAARELLRSRFSDLGWQQTACSLLRSRLSELRFIWLTRQNMVARAISHFRARRSGIWYQHHPLSNGGGIADEQLTDFELAEIHNLYCLGGFEEESWHRFFQEHEISPYRVIYEDLVADYEPIVRRVLRFLGLEGDNALIIPPRTLKQSDALSEDWEQRYRKLMGQYIDQGWAIRS